MAIKRISLAYDILNESSIKLYWQTNLTRFTCVCTHVFPTQKLIIVHAGENVRTAHFMTTSLKIPVKSLDCGSPLMNYNLQKSLNANRYPDIIIEFLEVSWNEPERPWESSDWVNLQVLTNVAINGRSSPYWLNVAAKKGNTGNEYACVCTKSILMTDFGVEPPTAMMGLVKVQNEIGIHLDLKISVG